MSANHPRRLRTPLAVLVATSALAASAATFGTSQAAAAPRADRQLGKHDRQLLAQARADGKSTVMLLIAATEGSNRAVLSDLASLGATVRYREDSIDYIRAVVPIKAVEAVANLAGVQAVDLDEVIPFEEPTPGPDGQQAPTPQTPPGSGTSQANPYMPIQDIKAVDFMAANPTWDGRGVTVGVIDSGIDLNHPALAKTTTGERKIVDWVTSTHFADDNDPTWLNMADQVSGTSFTYKAVTYTAPAAGSFRIALFNERDPRLGGEVGNDVNRDGNPGGSNGVFAILWNTTTNTVYVDANQNNTFADDLAMTDYKVRYDVGTFGVDNPATDVREAMPFVVQTDGKNKYVNIGIVSGAHGSHVAGIVAANGMFGGAMTGAAPGAKLVSSRSCMFVGGCTAHSLIEGMTYLAKQANVDVINMSIGGLPALNDGNNTRAVLYDRLIETYSVQMFISAGNSGAGINTIGDPSVAGKVMSVGSYIHRNTWQSNYGSDTSTADNLHPFSSRGPREDGGFKPQIVAPGSAISTVPTWQPGSPVNGTYVLPAGYAMFNGTSMASPQSAGGAALLVSAAQQAGAQHQPAQLRQAINSSARSLSDYKAYEQGNGLFNVVAAWNLLKTNIKTVDISSSVAVNTTLSSFLATPGVGQGIYDREGVTVGTAYTRTYTFTRTSGGGGTVNYALSWPDNDGTFSSQTTVALPLNRPVSVGVTVTPTSVGAHAARLLLDDSATTGVDYATMNVVIAADAFTAGNNFSVSKSGTVGRNQAVSHFFAVPARTPAFKVDFATVGGAGQARFLRFHPYGVGIDSSSSLSCYSPPVVPGGSCSNPNSRTVANPQAGVWEISVEARRTSDADPVPYTLMAAILGATVSPNPDVIATASVGVPVGRSYSLTNQFGAFTGKAAGTTLGSARRLTPTIANLAQQQYPVTVTAGSTSLRATIGGTSDPGADLDLFVYNCTTGTCVEAGSNADGDSEESVTIVNPAAGNWLVLVDGYSVPAGSTTYNYVDVFANAAFGTVAVTDANALRPAGASWTVPGSVTANAVPAAGRVLLGAVLVRTDSNVLVGSGDVIVENVTP